jgi:ABC-type multidrug transport system fused ATPase/permease subunit
MKKYLPVILLLLLVPISVNAQSILTEWFNIPPEWTKPPNLIYYVFIPFLGTFAIIWGILTATRTPIFRNQRVNIIISLVFTVALFYSSILPAIVLYLFSFGGLFGVLAFFVLFFVLTTMFGYRKVRTSYFKTLKSYKKAAESRREEINKITDLDQKMDALKKHRNELVTKRDEAELMLTRLEGWSPNDPEIRRLGLTKAEALRQTRDILNEIERNIRETDEKMKEILKLKKRLRKS